MTRREKRRERKYQFALRVREPFYDWLKEHEPPWWIPTTISVLAIGLTIYSLFLRGN